MSYRSIVQPSPSYFLSQVAFPILHLGIKPDFHTTLDLQSSVLMAEQSRA